MVIAMNLDKYMNSIEKIVKNAEKVVQSIEDNELRKIAFQIILEKLITRELEHITTEEKAEKKIPSKGKITLAEFLNKANPKTNPEKIVAIAYYMKIYEGISEFTQDDLAERFKRAALPLPGNMPRDIRIAIKKGFLERVREKGKYKYYITQSGIDFVEKLLKSET